MSDTRFTDAEAAVRTLLRCIGEDPERPELAATPKRVVRMLQSAFSGYGEDPSAAVGRLLPLTEVERAPVFLRNIPFESYCEHHMVPFTGRAHIAYMPRDGLVGIGGILRLLKACTARLQLQERLTAAIADHLQQAAGAAGTAVMLEAVHRCTRADGTLPDAPPVITRRFTGVFDDNRELRDEFFRLCTAAH